MTKYCSAGYCLSQHRLFGVLVVTCASLSISSHARKRESSLSSPQENCRRVFRAGGLDSRFRGNDEVYLGAFDFSHARKRESRAAHARLADGYIAEPPDWIPAFAGMTKCCSVSYCLSPRRLFGDPVVTCAVISLSISSHAQMPARRPPHPRGQACSQGRPRPVRRIAPGQNENRRQSHLEIGGNFPMFNSKQNRNPGTGTPRTRPHIPILFGIGGRGIPAKFSSAIALQLPVAANAAPVTLRPPGSSASPARCLAGRRRFRRRRRCARRR